MTTPSRPAGTDTPTPAASEPRLPHERDESSDNAADEPDAMIRQAKADLDSGQVDTDLRNGPGLDAERRDALLKKTPP